MRAGSIASGCAGSPRPTAPSSGAARAARDTAGWLSAIFHISNWKARRWVATAHAIEKLPHIAGALEAGSLSLDKVVELARFATPDDERKLVMWARRVTIAAIRRRGDEAAKREALEAAKAQHVRYLRSRRWDDHLEIEALLPMDEGLKLMASVDRLADQLPSEDVTTQRALGNESDFEETSIEQRRADALVLLATSEGGERAADTTVVLHAPIEALAGDGGGCTLDGVSMHPETSRRLTCDCRLTVVLEDADGNAVGIGRTSRQIPSWLRRQVLKRDGHTCTFPGCELKRFVQVHHVDHWVRDRGPTDLPNLLTVCTFHHKLLHEYGWTLSFDGTGPPVWFRDDGRRYEPGPIPSESPPPPLPDVFTYAEAAGYSRMFDLIAPRTTERKRSRKALLARLMDERIPPVGAGATGLI